MITTIIATAILAVGQQGGGGFGGGAAGAAGGNLGNIGDAEVSKNHILTPGDKAEWPLEVKAGDVIIFRAMSANFDPAIQVVDENNVKLAENDDEEPGMQNARLLVHFSKAGKYKAFVSNYRSNAGGQYTFSTQKFTAIDGALGKTSSFKLESDDAPAPAFRVAAEAGKVMVFRPKNAYFRRVIGPNGMVVETLPFMQSRFGMVAFETKDAGDYYLQNQPASRTEPVEIRPSIAHERTVGKDSQTNSSLAEGELDVWHVAIKKGDLVQVETSGKNSAKMFIEGIEPGEETYLDGNRDPWIDSASKGSNRFAVNAPSDATLRIFVGAPTESKDYKFISRAPWKTVGLTGTNSARLDVGSTDYFALDLKAGEILTLEATSSTFDAVMRLIGPTGKLTIFDDSTWPSTNPSETMVISDAGRYYIGISSRGEGGGGEYAFRAAAIPAKSISIGQSGSGSPKTMFDSIWDVAVPDGNPVSIRLTGDVSEGYWLLLGPDGQRFFPNEIRLSETDRMFVLVKPKPGIYRLWLQGIKVGGAYKIKVDRFG